MHPMFRGPLGEWLAAVGRKVGHIDVRVTEGRRTEARQRWLFAQGREAPFLDKPQVTWTMLSRHRWGLAADLAMIRKSTGEAIWADASWRWLYEQVPPAHFGLRHLAPTEWVHLELWHADAAIADADALALVQT